MILVHARRGARAYTTLVIEFGTMGVLFFWECTYSSQEIY